MPIHVSFWEPAASASRTNPSINPVLAFCSCSQSLVNPGPIYCRCRLRHRPAYLPGPQVILTVVDHFSKAAHFIPLPKLPVAKEPANTLVQQVFRLHGIPMDIVSDLGSQFVSGVWRTFCMALVAMVSLSSGFHPQSNGQTERTNQSLETFLRCMCSDNPRSWSTELPWIEYSHDSLSNSSLGMSLFQCSLGYQPPLFPDQEGEISVPSV